MPSIGPRGSQGGDKDRAYWVYVRDPGSATGWQRRDLGRPSNKVGSNSRSSINCLRNCDPFSFDNDFEVEEDGERDGTGGASAGVGGGGGGGGAGGGGGDGRIYSYFPPMEIKVDCRDDEFIVPGGQDFVNYELDLRVKGWMVELRTRKKILPFDTSRRIVAPGPIIGYSAGVYSFGNQGRDLKLTISSLTEQATIRRLEKKIGLGLSLQEGPLNLAISNNQYNFKVEEVTLENLTRTDGNNDSCGTSICNVTYAVKYYLQGDPNTIFIDEFTETGIEARVDRVQLTGAPDTLGRSIEAAKENGSDPVVIRTAQVNEVYVDVATYSTSCSYDVDLTKPSCTSVRPSICTVVISDLSGILYEDTFFEEPNVDVSPDYPEEFFNQ